MIFGILLTSTLLAHASDDFYTPNFKFSEKCLSTNIHKKSDDFKLQNIEVNIYKCAYLDSFNFWSKKSFNGRVISFKNVILGYFGVDNNLTITICSDSMDEKNNITGGCQELREGDITVQLPYFPNGKYADIFDPFGEKVLTIDLSSKATCNENDQCDQPIEDGENCPQDCVKQEPKIDPMVMQQAETEMQAVKTAQSEDGKISLSEIGWGWIAAILLIVTLFGGLGYYLYRKKQGILSSRT